MSDLGNYYCYNFFNLISFLISSGPNSPQRNIEKLRQSFIETDSLPIITLYNYHDWFRPTLLKWLQMSKGNTLSVITKAVEVDSAKRVDDIVKHSSSAVDTIACLTGISLLSLFDFLLSQLLAISLTVRINA